MSWVFLLLAGFMEVLGVISMKQYASSGKIYYLIAQMALFAISLFLLSLSMRQIPMGTAYAIWTGIGACGGVIVGITLYNEAKNSLKILLVGVIIACSVGLKYL
ncbi:DMT family transporter [Helicobacter sp. T3_23-1059]